MVNRGFAQLQDVIADADFPALDLALRRGCHVDRDHGSWYVLLLEAQEHLEAFYRRYGCELIHKTDGYFYLLPSTDQLPRRQLQAGDMLVGQALALLYLDPASVERGGLVTRAQVIEQLVTALGGDGLVGAFLPKRKRQDEQVAQRLVRTKIGEAIRRLASLGFVESSAEEQLRLRPALLRFAEPVRGLAEPSEALAKLVAQGEVALTDGTQADAGGDDSFAEEASAEDDTEDSDGEDSFADTASAHLVAGDDADRASADVKERTLPAEEGTSHALEESPEDSFVPRAPDDPLLLFEDDDLEDPA